MNIINSCATDTMQWEDHSMMAVVFLKKMHNLNTFLRKHIISLNWEIFYHETGLIFMSRLSKLKKDWGTVVDWRRHDNQLCVTLDRILLHYWDITRTSEEPWIGPEDFHGWLQENVLVYRKYTNNMQGWWGIMSAATDLQLVQEKKFFVLHLQLLCKFEIIKNKNKNTG